ncbi:hypothetical protein OG349_19185 [Streptomyces sp. NBC_01317]|uniref:hypothetical protein n=1 Tax=Streptomyces sp. NBC_01317 TaxID=2903822 RepID=UPI002E14D560|nr:hypothetical protein OG349_19185 [Streptomyces sp. NBC_01317]
MSDTSPVPAVVWMKREWKLRGNPFPATGMAVSGGSNARENGTLYEPAVHADQLRQVVDKFVLGMSYGGLKFGYLWSDGVVAGDSDSRGFGKTVLMHHMAGWINKDFGKEVCLSAGLDEEDAEEVPICCLVTGFDTSQIRTLSAALFVAVDYAVKSRVGNGPTLASRLRERLVHRTGITDARKLADVVAQGHRSLRGRTLGPPDEKLIAALCESDPAAAEEYMTRLTPTSRSRNGAVHMATFLLFAAAAGIQHVLVFCDQLEDLASTTTAKAKRDLEVERFRDVIVETLPMADMVTMVVTMHPRAAITIGTAWDLADLPSFALTEQNQASTVRLSALRDPSQVAQLLRPYVNAATKDGVARPDDELFPFTKEAVGSLFTRSNRKPRDVLRKAHTILEAAAARNLERIDAEDVIGFFDATGHLPVSFGLSSDIDWSRG